MTLFEQSLIEKTLENAGLVKPYLLDAVGAIKGKENCFVIYYYEKEFGNQRLTQRLVVVPQNGDSLGLYGIPERPTEIKNSTVYFNFSKKLGNHIDFNVHELPENIYLDGELYDLDLYKKTSTNLKVERVNVN